MKLKCIRGIPGFFKPGKEYPATERPDGSVYIYYGKGPFDYMHTDDYMAFEWSDSDYDGGIAIFEVAK